MKTSRLVPLLGTVVAVVTLAACAAGESESLKQANVIYNETSSCSVDAATGETITLWTRDDKVLTYEPGSDHYIAAKERCRTLSPGLFDRSWPTPTPTSTEEPADCAALLEQYKAEFAAFYTADGAYAGGADVTNDDIAAAMDRHVEMASSLLDLDCYLEFEEYGKFAVGVASGDEQGG